MKKVISRLIMFLIILMIISNFYQVFGIETLYPGDDPGTDNGITEATNIINMIIGITQIVGMFVAVAFLIFIGIKYMVASPGEKADIKSSKIIISDMPSRDYLVFFFY